MTHNNNSRCDSSSSEDVLILPELKKYWRYVLVFFRLFVPSLIVVPRLVLACSLVGYLIKEYGKYARNGRHECDDLLIHELKSDTSPRTRCLHRLEKILVQRAEEEEFVSQQRTKAVLLKRRREETVHQFRGGGSGSGGVGDGSAEENKGSGIVGNRNRNGSSWKSTTKTTTSNPFLVAMAAAAITTTTTTNNNEHGPVMSEDLGSQTIHELLQKLKYNKPTTTTTTISKSNNNNDDEEYLDLDLDNDIYEKYD